MNKDSSVWDRPLLCFHSHERCESCLCVKYTVFIVVRILFLSDKYSIFTKSLSVSGENRPVSVGYLCGDNNVITGK